MINPEILGHLNATEVQLIKHLNGDIREIFTTMVGGRVRQNDNV